MTRRNGLKMHNSPFYVLISTLVIMKFHAELEPEPFQQQQSRTI